MAGFNYGGFGDGTNWSSEKGSGPEPGGGSKGNAGNRSDGSTGSGGSGGSGNKAPNLAYAGMIRADVGEAAARESGLQPGKYIGYIVDDYGNVIGVFPSGEDDADGEELKTLHELGDKAKGLKQDGPIQGPGPGYTGDKSESHINNLRQTIRKNYNLTHSGQSGTRIYKAKQETFNAQKELAVIKHSKRQKAQEAIELQKGIILVTDFYSELTGKYSQRASLLAQQMAETSKGKTIRNIDQALASYEKYRNSPGARINAKDRAAIVNALKSINTSRMASELSYMSKALGYYGKIYNRIGVLQELIKSFETDNWRPVFVRLEALTAGRVAAAVTAFAFSILPGTPVGILGYALIMALVSALVDEKLLENINSTLGI